MLDLEGGFLPGPLLENFSTSKVYVIPWEIFPLQYLFLIFSEIGKFCFVSNCDYSLLQWLAYEVSVRQTYVCIKNIQFGLEYAVVMFAKFKIFHLFC